MAVTWIDLDLPELPGAVCQDLSDPEIFFSGKPHDTASARQVCLRCPVIRACLSWALTHNEPGVWAATTPEDRTRLRIEHTKDAAP